MKVITIVENGLSLISSRIRGQGSTVHECSDKRELGYYTRIQSPLKASCLVHVYGGSPSFVEMIISRLALMVWGQRSVALFGFRHEHSKSDPSESGRKVGWCFPRGQSTGSPRDTATSGSVQHEARASPRTKPRSRGLEKFRDWLLGFAVLTLGLSSGKGGGG